MDSVPVQAAELKPMTLSELLDRTFTLYRNRFWLFCGLMVGPEIAILVCSLIVIVAFPIRDIGVVTQRIRKIRSRRLRRWNRRLAATFVAGFVQALFGALALGAVTVAVSELYLGRAATIRGSYEVVRGRIFGLFGLILMLMLVGIAFLTAGSFAGGFAGAIGMIASRSDFAGNRSRLPVPIYFCGRDWRILVADAICGVDSGVHVGETRRGGVNESKRHADARKPQPNLRGGDRDVRGAIGVPGCAGITVLDYAVDVPRKGIVSAVDTNWTGNFRGGCVNCCCAATDDCDCADLL